jgi:hypothetical protein
VNKDAELELKALGVELRNEGHEAEINWRNAEQIGEWLLAVLDENEALRQIIRDAITWVAAMEMRLIFDEVSPETRVKQESIALVLKRMRATAGEADRG